MRYGIPRYRLPREVLDAEIARIAALGVRFETESCVDDLEQAMKDGGFEAAFLGVGAQSGKNAYIPAGDSAHVLDALTVLAATAAGSRSSGWSWTRPVSRGRPASSRPWQRTAWCSPSARARSSTGCGPCPASRSRTAPSTSTPTSPPAVPASSQAVTRSTASA